ncbi:MAG TPA: hypothetical protein VFM00_07215 [Candidatus Eisenbacteria bacterium]|nr:hypothetical protein [Candidatus Eisenbacteria bacterium]
MALRRHPGSGTLDALRVRWHPRDFPLRGAAETVLRAAVRELSLEHVVRDLHVRVDLDNRDDHAYIEWNTHDHRAARLSFAIGNFVTRARRRAWSRTWGKRPGTPPLTPRQFSAKSFSEACLHELSHLRDDHQSGVDLTGAPASDREGLNELWNVWIDGRLNRRGLPAMTRGERRRVYVRTLRGTPRFRARGERVFQALWNADHLGPRELRAYLAELTTPLRGAVTPAARPRRPKTTRPKARVKITRSRRTR